MEVNVTTDQLFATIGRQAMTIEGLNAQLEAAAAQRAELIKQIAALQHPTVSPEAAAPSH